MGVRVVHKCSFTLYSSSSTSINWCTYLKVVVVIVVLVIAVAVAVAVAGWVLDGNVVLVVGGKLLGVAHVHFERDYALRLQPLTV